MTLEERAKKVIDDVLYITIASVSEDGQPWNTPVYSGHDEDYNFYWISWKENQHSKNIAQNEKIFLVIYDSTVPEGTGFGVYFQATAQALTDENEIKTAVAHVYTRTGQAPDKHPPEEYMGDSPRRVYKATPIRCWVNQDDRVDGKFVDTRVEIKL